MGVFSVFGARGDAEGVRGAAQVLNTKNAPHWARFSFSAGGDRWSSAKHEKHATWARFSCLAGRGGEGRGRKTRGRVWHPQWMGEDGGRGTLATEHEKREHERAKHKKHAPCGVFFVFGRWEREGDIGGGVGRYGRGQASHSTFAFFVFCACQIRKTCPMRHVLRVWQLGEGRRDR